MGGKEVKCFEGDDEMQINQEVLIKAVVKEMCRRGGGGPFFPGKAMKRGTTPLLPPELGLGKRGGESQSPPPPEQPKEEQGK